MKVYLMSREAFLRQIGSLLVPHAGIEPALLSEPHFECGASTNSANGAHGGSEHGLYHGLANPRKGEPEGTCACCGPSLAPADPEDRSTRDAGEGPHEETYSHSARSPWGRQINLWDHIEAFPWEYRGFVRRVRGLAGRTSIPNGWMLEVVYDSRGYFYLQVSAEEGTCNVTGEPLSWKGRKWLLSPHMTDGEVLQTALKAVLTAAEHELREQFLVDGQPIFDPHFDLDRMVTFSADEASRLVREKVVSALEA